MLAGMRDRGHVAVGVQLASLDRQTSASRTPRPYTIVVLIYARRSRWLVGWLAGWLVHGCQIYDLCASLLACREPLQYCNTV